MRELLFADDSALVAHSAEEMQNIVDTFFRVDEIKLNSVLDFTYLGSTILSNRGIDDEIQRSMGKVSASFGRLRERLWNNHHVSMRVKGKIYRGIVLSTLIYGAEAWTVYIR